MIKRVGLLLALLVGLFWIISPFVLGYPSKTQAEEHLTSSFRPVFSDAGVTQSNADRATIDTFSTDFTTKALPALAVQLNETTSQLLTGTLGAKYPAVQTGLAQLPTIVPYVDNLLGRIQTQQHNFQQADAIPTSSLPNTTVTWLFVVPGALAALFALVGLVRPGSGALMAGLAVLVGVGVIAASLILSIPAKTQGADDLTNAFRPLFTTSGVAQASGYLKTVEAMQTQLTTQALPQIAVLLNQTPAEFAGKVATDFPTVADGLTKLPGVLQRLDDLISLIRSNLDNFRQADAIPTAGTPTTLVQAQLVVPAAVLIVAGLLGVGGARLATRSTRPSS